MSDRITNVSRSIARTFNANGSDACCIKDSCIARSFARYARSLRVQYSLNMTLHQVRHILRRHRIASTFAETKPFHLAKQFGLVELDFDTSDTVGELEVIGRRTLSNRSPMQNDKFPRHTRRLCECPAPVDDVQDAATAHNNVK